MKQLAIPLGRQKTAAQWLVINKTRREQKMLTQYSLLYKETFFVSNKVLWHNEVAVQAYMQSMLRRN